MVDTNLFVAALFNKKSAAFKIFNKAMRGEIIFIFSKNTLKELNFILKNIKANPKFLKKIEKIIKNSKIIESPQIIKEIKEDPSDNKFLSVALSGKADFILSNDKHLLSLKEFFGIPILTSKNFLKIIDNK